ncbi:MAG: NAD(+)/NADH kinase [Clostridia bacterium]|nr:NAD(+)/NADH kinase [Clostridia bacterium]
MNKGFNKIGLIPNELKDKNLKITWKLQSWLCQRGCKVYIPSTFKKQKDDLNLNFIDFPAIFNACQMVIVLGGDGTLLRVAKSAAHCNTPILGVNLGRLGYLTEIEIKDMFEVISQILEGNYIIEKRMMLKAKILKGTLEKTSFLALNDVGVAKGSLSRMILLKTYIDDYFVDTFPADGLIVSSPTGSTAYSLSAGGPIISPKMESLLITPICPHTLHSRPIVISDSETVKIKVVGDYENILVTIDGQEGYSLNKGEVVLVSKADIYTQLVRYKDKNFYSILRKKLSERKYEQYEE